MKRVLILCVFVFFLFAINANAQSFKIRSDAAIQIGYETYKYLSFGGCDYATQNNGEWAIEYWDVTGGLNFWKPSPSVNSGNFKLFLKDNGNIGVGTSTPSYKFTVFGNIAAYGTVLISSDRRLKDEIRPLGRAMDKLYQLNGVAYKKHLPVVSRYDSDVRSVTDEVKLNTISRDSLSGNYELERNENYGFVAQELMEVFPELVSEDDDGYLGIDYISLIPVMVEAMKELREEIEMLKSIREESELFDKNVLENDTSKENSIQKATLFQNLPNPFSNETEMRYYIPENAEHAFLLIFDMQGSLKKQIQITQMGNGSVKINAAELQAGMYIYSLIVDGFEFGSKKMILTK